MFDSQTCSIKQHYDDVMIGSDPDNFYLVTRIVVDELIKISIFDNLICRFIKMKLHESVWIETLLHIGTCIFKIMDGDTLLPKK